MKVRTASSASSARLHREETLVTLGLGGTLFTPRKMLALSEEEPSLEEGSG
jgi:hypothetical protein